METMTIFVLFIACATLTLGYWSNTCLKMLCVMLQLTKVGAICNEAWSKAVTRKTCEHIEECAPHIWS